LRRRQQYLIDNESTPSSAEQFEDVQPLTPLEIDELCERLNRGTTRPSPPVAVGDRVRLLGMHADPNPVPAGTLGTVRMLDGVGTIHVTWDNGRSLGLIPGVDSYERVNEAV
jgi:hypothetical protein